MEICTCCSKNIFDMPDPTWTYINDAAVCWRCFVKGKLVQRARKRLKVVA